MIQSTFWMNEIIFSLYVLENNFRGLALIWIMYGEYLLFQSLNLQKIFLVQFRSIFSRRFWKEFLNFFFLIFRLSKKYECKCFFRDQHSKKFWVRKYIGMKIYGLDGRCTAIQMTNYKHAKPNLFSSLSSFIFLWFSNWNCFYFVFKV